MLAGGSLKTSWKSDKLLILISILVVMSNLINTTYIEYSKYTETKKRTQSITEQKNRINALLKKAENGNIEAQLELASFYRGLSSPNAHTVQYPEAAIKWWLKAAEQGNAEAQIQLSYIYNIECKNWWKEKPFCSNSVNGHWLQIAAESGNIKAQRELGYVLSGIYRDTDKNDTEAMKWFQRAAVQGDKDAQTRVGVHFAEGIGTKQNWQEAYFWLTVSSKTSSTSLKVLDHLTDEEIQDIIKRREKWKPTLETPKP